MIAGRLHARRLVGLIEPSVGSNVLITSPGVGFWRPRMGKNALVHEGDVIGALEILGESVEIVAPCFGLSLESTASHVARPVAFGDRLIHVDTRAGIVHVDDAAVGGARVEAATGLVFPAPISGRFFAKPGPNKPPFVAIGAILEPGQTVCMLEVMKTFNRVTYGGGGLPERARVVAILVDDEADVTMGQAILQVEAAT
jgi:acetyl-CoA carboxylase biotin carboxyl carrier protein